MRISLDIDEHFALLNNYLDYNPDRILISSYGIYAGITFANQDTAGWGDKYQLATRAFMDRLVSVSQVQILIGIADYRSCKANGQCLDCERQYVKSIIRLLNHAETFKHIQWRMATDLHIKGYIFEYGNKIKGISSGRNLSDSSWKDVSVQLTESECNLIKSYIIRVWGESLDINGNQIATVFANQKISEQGFNSVSE